MSMLWNDPEFRKRHRERAKNRRPRGEAKAEKEERQRRREVKRKLKEHKRKLREEKNRKRQVIEEFIKENHKQREAVNTEWMTCLSCGRILPASKIVDKRFNLCIDCKDGD